jgi:periplasmic copper chaperone A
MGGYRWRNRWNKVLGADSLCGDHLGRWQLWRVTIGSRAQLLDEAIMLRSLLPVTLIFLGLAACGGGETSTSQQAMPQQADPMDGPPRVEVTVKALRLSANPDAPSAGYITLTSRGEAETLTGVTSPDAARVEMHESRRENGMVTMASVTQIEVPANGTVAMRPGGLHLMIFGINEAARRRGSVELALSFSSGRVGVMTLTTDNLANFESEHSASHGEDHSNH